MSSVFGKNVKVSIFGESHGTAIGCVVDGFPAGVTLDRDLMECVLSRRRAKATVPPPHVWSGTSRSFCPA